MRHNRLRELISAGKPTVGTHLESSWPTMVELVGHSGAFDYVEFLADYAPYDLYALENLGRAIQLFDHMSGMIKIEQQPRIYMASKALQSGFQNVLFTDVRTVADVEECVAAVRPETPELRGKQGATASREVGVLLEVGSAAFVQARKDSVVAIMIEKKDAIDNLDALLSVKGLDMVQFGPADYAISIGLAGMRDHPSVREAEEFMIATALKKGIVPRGEIREPGQAERYLNLGVKHFCMGWDYRILFDWYKENGARLHQMLADIHQNPLDPSRRRE